MENPNEPKPRPDLPDLSKWGFGEAMQVGGQSKLKYQDIVMFIHCEFCMKERPDNVSPSEFASFEVGMAKNRKLAIYCKRHKLIVGEFTLKNPPPLGPCQCGNPDCQNTGSYEREDEPAFELGEVTSSAGLDAWMTANGGNDAKQRLLPYLYRHHHGDGGDIDPDEQLLNFAAIMKGGARVMSVYNVPELPSGKLWIITEEDRSKTTLLLPEDY